MKKVLILCGLPGSGKSTFANNFKDKHKIIYNVDEWVLSKKPIQNLLSTIRDKNDNNTHILDGLFLNNNSYKNTLQYFKNDTVEFHYWFPNRDICLHNDKGRREKDSSITIIHANLEKPNVFQLKSINPNISLIKHHIIRKDDKDDNEL